VAPPTYFPIRLARTGCPTRETATGEASRAVLEYGWASPRWRITRRTFFMNLVIATGVVLICFAIVLDTLVRLRLRDAGERSTFLKGGTLDYGRYLRLRNRTGWSPWPVYLIPLLLVTGIAMVLLSFLKF
jgi:H+/Cl- antiporter ClcA